MRDIVLVAVMWNFDSLFIWPALFLSRLIMYCTLYCTVVASPFLFESIKSSYVDRYGKMARENETDRHR